MLEVIFDVLILYLLLSVVQMLLYTDQPFVLVVLFLLSKVSGALDKITAQISARVLSGVSIIFSHLA